MSKDFKVKNGLQVTTHITASGNISSSGDLFVPKINVYGPSGGSGQIYINDADNGLGVADGFFLNKSGTNAFLYNRDSGHLEIGTNDIQQLHIEDSATTEGQLKIKDGGIDVTGHITASGNISASGTGIHRFGGIGNFDRIIVDDISIDGSQISDGGALTILATDELLLNSSADRIRATANITASGNISASGNIYTDGFISSSGGINAGTTGVTTANTGHISSSQYDLGGYYNGSIGFAHQNLWRFSASAESSEGQAANLEMYRSGVKVNHLSTIVGGTSYFGHPGGHKFGFNNSSPQDAGITVTGQISASGNLEIDGNATIDGVLTATRKSFLIPHPTKQDKQLQYASLEGPENGVYIRGKLKGDNIIKLPDYWTELIDKDSITVSLTPIGNFQYLYVRDINSKEIMVGISEKPIRRIYCHYVIYAERKDIDKLEVEI